MPGILREAGFIAVSPRPESGSVHVGAVTAPMSPVS